MKKNILYLYAILLCFYSCKNNHIQVKDPGSAKVDTILIPIDEQYTQNYTALRNRIQSNHFYGFNNKLHTIDIFDLYNKKHVSKIEIQKEGPNGIPNLNAFTVISDSIIIQNSSHFIIIDQNGSIVKKISKEKLNTALNNSDYSLQPTYVTLANFEDIAYDNKRNELIAPVNSINPRQLKNKNCIASIHLNSEKVELLPVYFPESVIDKYYGKLGVPQILCKGDSLIYNFANSSHIYIFNRITKAITDHTIESAYTSNISEALDENADMKKQFDHYLHALFFHSIQYDKDRNQYYRIHTDKNDDISAFNNKDTYLTIMNADFEKIDEIKLPANFYPIFNVTKQGLLFEFMQAPEENAFSYMMITSPHIPVINKQEPELSYTTPTSITTDSADIIRPSVIKKNTSTVHLTENEKMTAEKISQFVQKNMIYPPNELENKVEGLVFIILKCDKTGKVTSCETTDAPVTTTDNKELIKEALRIGSLIKYINPDIFCFHVPFNIDRYKQLHNK